MISPKKIYKKLIQIIFKFFYGTIQIASEKFLKENLIQSKIIIEKVAYKIFSTKKCRLFTTSVHDQSVIIQNKLIKGPSFQLRVDKNDNLFARNNGLIDENIVLKIGTPRILKRIKGNVFSLLSGGAAKTNYFHWLFEILPKLEILSKFKKLEDINYFLVPSTKMTHQLETLELLNISRKKLLDSNSFKHIFCDELFVVDHPFRLTNNTVYDTQNIPSWIFKWLRKNFLQFKSQTKFPKKFFIDRSESISKYRSIYNHTEVYDYFKKQKFEFIKPENFSFKDQINLYNSAEKIAGLHGAGFANICFCNPGTKIIEFKTSGTGMNSGNIAFKNNLDYRGIICDAFNKFGGQQGKLVVPLDEIKKNI